MPETNQLSWTHKELAILLVKAADLHEGRWQLTVQFAMAPGNFGPSDDQMSPGMIVATANVGLARLSPDQKATNLVVDAAEVNPLQKSSRARLRRRSPTGEGASP
jgi:hypothetical protein